MQMQWAQSLVYKCVIAGGFPKQILESSVTTYQAYKYVKSVLLIEFNQLVGLEFIQSSAVCCNVMYDNTMEDRSTYFYVLVMYMDDVFIVIFDLYAFSSINLDECD